MRKPLKAVFTLFLCSAALASMMSLAAPGGPSDPAVTKGYIDGFFLPSLYEYASDKFGALTSDSMAAADAVFAKLRAEADTPYAARAASKQIVLRTDNYAPASLQAGEALRGGDGTLFMIQSGEVHTEGTVIDFTNGTQIVPGCLAPAGHLLGSLDGGGLMARENAVILVKGGYRLLLPNAERYTELADELNSMGLFLGTGLGYELMRPATRAEAIMMLLRLFGEEEAAAAYTGAAPFTDISGWYVPYVSYAYAKGYTTGSSATTFSPQDAVTADMYCTFVLTALGYSKVTDYEWNKSLDFAVSEGLLTAVDLSRMRDYFNRDEMVFISHTALGFHYKDTSTTLLQKLHGE